MQINSFQLDQLGHAGGVAKRSVATRYRPQLWAGVGVQIAARPGIAILATQSGVPIHSGCSQSGLAAVTRAAGCGDMPGRWRRGGAWRTPADRAGADAGEGELLPG
jgi:hypothetical protein